MRVLAISQPSVFGGFFLKEAQMSEVLTAISIICLAIACIFNTMAIINLYLRR